MADDQEPDLQEESNWDFEQAETRPPTRSNRVVVSVAFTRPDFEQVAEYAESVNMKTSEFIRTAALEKAGNQAEASNISCSVSNARFIISGSSIGIATHVRASVFQSEPAITA